LFCGAESPSAALAAAVADGARTIRFTEVDVRALGAHEMPTGMRAKRLESVDSLMAYDGIVIAGSSAGAVPEELSTLFDALEQRLEHDAAGRATAGPFVDLVFGVVGEENTDLLGRVGRLGGIIIGEGAGEDPVARAARLGARVAKVIGWVRHALGHEAGAHEHHHEHGHHDHPHDHHHH
jgi:hypothetical protein